MTNQPFWAQLTIIYDASVVGVLEPVMITGSLYRTIQEYCAQHNIRDSVRRISVDDYLRLPKNHPMVTVLSDSLKAWPDDTWQYQVLLFLKLARNLELCGITTTAKERKVLEVVKRDLKQVAEFTNKFGDVDDHPYGHVALIKARIEQISSKIKDVESANGEFQTGQTAGSDAGTAVEHDQHQDAGLV